MRLRIPNEFLAGKFSGFNESQQLHPVLKLRRQPVRDGRVFIESVNRTRLPSPNSPFVIGDEVVSVDGTPVRTARSFPGSRDHWRLLAWMAPSDCMSNNFSSKARDEFHTAMLK